VSSFYEFLATPEAGAATLAVNENALRESEARFRELADNISQFAWTADAEGWIFWYNQRWYDYTGTTLEQMQGWGWQKVHHPEHVDRVVQRIRHSFETGTPWEDTFPLRSKDGHYRWFLSRALPIRNGAGEVIRWFGTNTDVTEQIEAENALRESEARLVRANAMLQLERDNKLMTLQAAMTSIAHEIKQPLASLTLNAEVAKSILSRASAGLEGVHEALDDVIDGSLRVSQILDNVRHLFGKGQLHKERIDVNELALATLRLVRGELTDHGVAASVEAATDLPHVVGHRVQLQEVMFNLVHNAIEAMAAVKVDRRSLNVRTSHQAGDDLGGGKTVLIEVEDTGPGIDPDRLGAIFDAFVTTKEHGTGLGLAICRTIIERHGGKLTASSDGKCGALFRVVLPIEPGYKPGSSPAA
jgi:PAS domain S-box-containing protein